VMVMVMLCSAVEVGVDMLELDCHMTKDGEVVVCHDDNLERVTGLPVRISDTLLKVSTACFVKFHMSIQILCIWCVLRMQIIFSKTNININCDISVATSMALMLVKLVGNGLDQTEEFWVATQKLSVRDIFGNWSFATKYMVHWHCLISVCWD